MIKIVQYGCGKMSKYIMRYALENGYEIVGAFDINPNVIGKDIGDIIGTSKKGIIVKNAAYVKDELKKLNPDICIVTTMSLIKDVKDILLICAEEGINVITTCEEAFYPFNSSPVIVNEINEIAIKNNCTITGSGYQEAFWGNLISTLAGITHNITKTISIKNIITYKR